MEPLILIIDDDASLGDAMAETLRDSGYRVLCAENSEAGLTAARKHRPDLILCDVVLPDAQGFDIIISIRGESSRLPSPQFDFSISHSLNKDR